MTHVYLHMVAWPAAGETKKGQLDAKPSIIADTAPGRQTLGRVPFHFVRAAPSANTEFGAVTLMGLTTGWVEMARLMG